MCNLVVPISATVAFSLLLAGCTVERFTSPPRTATEQLLISTAADRAAEKLAEQISPGLRIYLDTSSINAPDATYATFAIRDHLLRRGVALVEDRASADAIVQVRAGALSTDEDGIFLGTPPITLPAIPGIAGGTAVPSLNLFKRAETKATAKFAATGYDPRTGQLVLATDPQYGFSQKVDWALLLFLSWTNQDYLENEKQ